MSVDDDQQATDAFIAREAAHVSEAVASVKRLEAFHATPTVENGETVIGWLWRIARAPLSPHVAETQLRADLYAVSRQLRGRIFSLPELDPQRAAVVLHVAETQLRADLYAVSRQLRGRIFSLPELDPQRAAVVLHVALVIGSDALMAESDLWDALRRADYNAASDCLLLSRWTAMAGDDITERRRVLAMARQMRDGVPA